MTPVVVRRRAVRVVLALLVLLLVAAGLWIWNATRFPAGHERLAGTPIDLRVQDGVPAAEARFVREGILLEHGYLERLGGAPRRAVEARVARSNGCRAFESVGEGATGTAEAGFLCIDTRVPIWSALIERPLHATLVSAHEYVHVWQAELGCLPGPDDHTHRWLIEGMASHLAWQAAIAAGRATDADAVAYIRRLGGWRPDLPELAAFERASGDDAAYALWQRAVRNLRGGDGALRAFCVAVAGGTPWQRAFATSFDESVPAFYARFARLRDAG